MAKHGGKMKQGNFTSKDAPTHLTGKNYASSFRGGGPGAGQVGNRVPNPYGPDKVNSGGKGSTNKGGGY